MPEGDSIHRLAAQLREVLAGQPVVQVEVARPTRGGPRPPAPGTLVESVDAAGKHLLIRFADGTTLRTHLQMHGRWQWYATGEPWRGPRHRMRARVEVPGVEAVCFDAPTAVLERAPAVGHLGPDLCRPDADLDECVARMATLAGPATPVGDVLLDQRIACGVGNVYKSEVCFACRVDPVAPIATIPDELRYRLVATAAQMLQANLGPGPRTTVAGRPGALAVYGRARRPCPRCGTTIRVARTGVHARSTYWCPSCQAESNRVERSSE